MLRFIYARGVYPIVFAWLSTWKDQDRAYLWGKRISYLFVGWKGWFWGGRESWYNWVDQHHCDASCR